MKKNIVIPREYEVNWEKKTQRIQAGVFFEKDWKMFWILNVIPTNWDWKFNVFEQEKKDKPAEELPF